MISDDAVVNADTAARRSGRLLQVLGLGFGLAVAIGNTIGAGILRTPGDVAGHLPDPALFLAVWIAGPSNAAADVSEVARSLECESSVGVEHLRSPSTLSQ